MSPHIKNVRLSTQVKKAGSSEIRALGQFMHHALMALDAMTTVFLRFLVLAPRTAALLIHQHIVEIVTIAAFARATRFHLGPHPLGHCKTMLFKLFFGLGLFVGALLWQSACRDIPGAHGSRDSPPGCPRCF